jgi:hypothetical protein
MFTSVESMKDELREEMDGLIREAVREREETFKKEAEERDKTIKLLQDQVNALLSSIKVCAYFLLSFHFI